MNEINTAFKVNKKLVKLNVKADTFNLGNDIVMFNEDITPAHFSKWKDIGYTITNFLDIKEITTFNTGITDIVSNFLKKYLDVAGFELKDYHKFVDNKIHKSFMDDIRAGSKGQGGILLDLFPISISLVEDRLSEICGCEVTCRKTSSGHEVNNFWIRIVRPLSLDNNPPHRDVHLDRSRGAVNLYFPIAGSDSNSSLPLIPMSHLWPESEIVRTFGKTLINDIEYTNPATVSSVNGLEMITPNPSPEEVLVFSPYMLHGGGVNFNTNTTRVSLEMRFWLK
jgi:hypothetical protein